LYGWRYIRILNRFAEENLAWQIKFLIDPANLDEPEQKNKKKWSIGLIEQWIIELQDPSIQYSITPY